MPLEINIDIDDVGNFLDYYNNARRLIAAAAAVVLQDAIELQFDTQGQAYGFWQPLSELTKQIKRREGAPDPERILYEWGTLRNSVGTVDRSDDNHVSFGVGIYDYAPTGQYAAFTTAFKRPPKPSNKASSEAWKTVSRAYIHEFGGWELQDIGGGVMEEVITRGMHQAALKGYSFIARAEWEVRKKFVDKMEQVGRVVYIPRRSFIRDSFDAVENDMIDEIIDTINTIFDGF